MVAFDDDEASAGRSCEWSPQVADGGARGDRVGPVDDDGELQTELRRIEAVCSI
ncbi:unnamed protein product [Linum tenue]|uniref:Uncharacterized protein n=1 Tax=Linum tenue TaxID=586396 RepID=A0AAV0PDK3_9ROSI|nr:unnamed protein product [Linum tenue]